MRRFLKPKLPKLKPKKKKKGMHEIVKGFFTIFFFLAFGFIVCTAYAFLAQSKSILPNFYTSFHLAQSIQYFITLLPAFLITALTIGYSFIFGTGGHNTVNRYSLVLLTYLKHIFILLFFYLALYFSLREAVLPRVMDFQKICESKTQTYYDFIQASTVFFEKKDYDNASQHAKYALLLWNKSPKATQLRDKAKIYKMITTPQQSIIPPDMAAQQSISIPDNLTPQQALKAAKKSMQRKDFYTAHFYALKCVDIAKTNSNFKKEGKYLADLTWRQIEKGFNLLNAQFDIELYREKRKAYTLLHQKEYIEAYYRFLAIQKMIQSHKKGQKDLDVNRLLAITKEKMLTQVFFDDETTLFPIFASSENIAFTVTEKKRNIRTLIKIQQLAFIPNEEIYNLYGRNAEITHYDSDGTIIAKYLVPFTKFIQFADRNGVPVLNMQITTVGKTHHHPPLKPLTITGSTPYKKYEPLMLPLSIHDLHLIISACKSEKRMTLSELYLFHNKASKYGFEPLIYTREIIFRLSSLLVILIISVYALTLGWCFRLPPHTRYETWWILAVPVISYVSWFTIQIFLHASKLLIVLLTDYFGFYTASSIIALCYSLLFTALCFLFFAQQSDN